MHLSFISLSHCIEILYNRYYASNVTEPESDAGMSSHRFTDYDGQSVVFGTIITQFLEVFFLQIWRHFRFWHLFDARKVSRKFGMTHISNIHVVVRADQGPSWEAALVAQVYFSYDCGPRPNRCHHLPPLLPPPHRRGRLLPLSPPLLLLRLVPGPCLEYPCRLPLRPAYPVHQHCLSP